ncbi:MAG: tyrosine-type recombinase/integrase [Phycisphaerae bacterium]
MAEKKSKIGRGRRFVRFEGREIYGLSVHKPSGRYYRLVKGKRDYLGCDLELASFELRRRRRAEEKPQEKLSIDISVGDGPFPKSVDWDELIKLNGRIWLAEFGKWFDIGKGDTIEIDEEYIWRKARELILKNQNEASLKLNIPQIANLMDLIPPSPSLALSEVAELYYNKRKTISHHERKDSESFWNQFCDIVKVKTVRELMIDHIRKYQDEIYAIQQNEEFSSTYVLHRFSKIKTMFSNAMKNGTHQDELRKMLDYCKILENPEKPRIRPNPIKREHFLAMYNAFDNKYRAILLLALNVGFYPKDFQDLTKSDLDLNSKTLIMDRRKTGVLRVGILWDRTVEAIQAYLDECNPKSETLFVTEFDTPITHHGIRYHWKSMRRKIEIPDTVLFEQIRDGSQTAAILGGATQEEVNYLLGHKADGVTDAYLMRLPQLTTKAVKAIEKYYFGSSPKTDAVPEKTSKAKQKKGINK